VDTGIIPRLVKAERETVPPLMQGANGYAIHRPRGCDDERGWEGVMCRGGPGRHRV